MGFRIWLSKGQPCYSCLLLNLRWEMERNHWAIFCVRRCSGLWISNVWITQGSAAFTFLPPGSRQCVCFKWEYHTLPEDVNQPSSGDFSRAMLIYTSWTSFPFAFSLGSSRDFTLHYSFLIMTLSQVLHVFLEFIVRSVGCVNQKAQHMV